jgi:hypothetical protein
MRTLRNARILLSTDAKRSHSDRGSRDHWHQFQTQEVRSPAIQNVLKVHTNLQVTIGWASSAKGLLALRPRLESRLRLLVERLFPAFLPRRPNFAPSPPPRARGPSTSTKRDGLPVRAANWRTSPPQAPRTRFHRFIQDVSDFSRPIFSTDIRFLVGHAFTGEHTAYFQPQSYDLHHCPCENPSRQPRPPRHRWLRVTCALRSEARRQFIFLISISMSISSLQCDGRGPAFRHFLASTTACLRP